MLKVVFIDTVLLAGLTDHEFRSFPPKAPKSIKIVADQWAFINQTLAEYSKTDGWTIVVGHYPGASNVYSTSLRLVVAFRPLYI